jgi:hypothetical protein
MWYFWIFTFVITNLTIKEIIIYPAFQLL